MLSSLINILLVILVLGILIFIHELGHFLAAKLAKVRVDAFAIGMGPKIFSKAYGETTYQLNLLPIGGYVSILGEVLDEEDSESAELKDPRNFQNKHPLVKIAILLAGVTFNFMTAVLIFYFFLGMSDNRFSYPSEIAGFEPKFGSLQTEILGELEYSDLTEDGAAIKASWPTSGFIRGVGESEEKIDPIIRSDEFSFFARDNKGKDVYVEICESAWDGCEVFPVTLSEEGFAGILLSRNYWDFVQYEGLEITFGGFVHSINTLDMALANLGKIFSDASDSGDYSTAVNSVAGPVGLYYIVNLLKTLGVLGILDLIANLSLTLFLINSLPIPALDGGRVMLVLAEWGMGRFFNKKIELWLIRISFILLMILMLGIIVKDIVYIDVLRELFS